jgi:hypothetical protein
MKSERWKNKEKKIQDLCDAFGEPLERLLKNASWDSVVPAICMREGCDYTTEYEPDQDSGWCEECGEQTVVSILRLAGVV